jgi:hypothetical protein
MRMESICEEAKDVDHLIIRSNSSSSDPSEHPNDTLLLTPPSNLVLIQSKQEISFVDDEEEGEYFDALDSDEEEMISTEDIESREQKKRTEEFLAKALEFKPYDLHDDFRIKDGAHKDGGFPLDDAEILAKYR